MKWARKLVIGTKEHENFSKAIADSYPALENKYRPLENDAKSQLSAIERVLASEAFKEINGNFEHLEKKSRSVRWFTVSGPTSISDLASKLGRKVQYEILYHQFSKVTHASAISQHVTFKEQRAVFEPIRDLKHIDNLISIPLSLTFDVYEKIVLKYRREDIREFSTKYVNEWRKDFLNIPHVVYEQPGSQQK
jgi:hypothetical protein